MAQACVLASFLLLLLSGVTPALPKRFLYPPAAFALLCAFVPPLFRQPLPPWGGGLLDLAQLLLGLGMVLGVWGGLRPAPFGDRIAGRPLFSWRHLLVAFAVFWLVFVPLAGLWLVVAGARGIEAQSGGFMLFHWDRLEMRAKKYVRGDGKEIDLVPMIHIGEGDFYGQVAASFPADTVVLTEGISDRSRIAPRLDYAPVATALGLSSQSTEFKGLAARTRAEVRPADVDYADFSPEVREMIRAVAEFVAHPDRDHYRAFQQEWYRLLSADPGLQERFFDEVLVRRNAHVLKEADAALPEVQRVVLPWGAMHMPGLEKGVLSRGFRASETSRFDAIRYRTILAALGQALRAPREAKAAGAAASVN